MKSSNNRFELLLFLFLASFYLLTAVGYVSTSMGITAYETARSLFEEGDIALNQPTLETGVGKDGRYYTYEGIVFIFVVTLFYALSRFAGMHPNQWGIVTNQLLMPVACVLLFLIGRELKYSRRTSVLMALIYGIATMAWAHARYLMPEPLTAVVYLAAFLFLLKYKNLQQRRWLLWAGCLAGVSLLVRSDAPVFVLGLSVGLSMLLLGEYRKSPGTIRHLMLNGLVFVLPIVIFIAIYAYYNYARFGDVLELGYSTKAEIVTEATGEVKAHTVENIRGTLLGFAGMWIVPCRSMFFINPVLIFIFWSLKDFWKKHRVEFVTIGILLFLHVLLYSNRGSDGFSGSSAWGIRYMVPMTAFMVIIMGVFVENIIMRRSDRRLRNVFIIVLTLSVVIQFVGASMNYQVTQVHLERELRTTGDEWAARRVMNLNPKWNLITQNLQWLRQGQADFMYYNYLRRGDFITHPRENLDDAPAWVWPSFLFLLVIFGASGYMLFNRFMTLETAPVERKELRSKKRRK